MEGDVNATVTDEVEDDGFEILDDELDFMNYFLMMTALQGCSHIRTKYASQKVNHSKNNMF